MIWELTQDAADEQSLLKVINDTLASETYVEGDVNDDGSFDTADLVLFQRWLLNDPDVELTNLKSADICDDGSFDTADLVLFQKWLLNEPDAELKNRKSADICEDSRLDVFDMCAMRKMLPY